MADDQVADGQAPDDLTQGVRVCVANLTKVTDELSDAVKVKDEERAKLTEKIESLEYAASFHARGMAELEGHRTASLCGRGELLARWQRHLSQR